jgi:hypothetical protein
MPANIYPISIGKPITTVAASTTSANTATDGTGTVILLYTADATYGGYVRGIRVKGLGTNVASVMRVFINNGATNATATNNTLIAELALTATTASNSAIIGSDFYLPLNQVLQAAYKINVCFGTAGAGGWQASAEAADFVLPA